MEHRIIIDSRFSSTSKHPFSDTVQFFKNNESLNSNFTIGIQRQHPSVQLKGIELTHVVIPYTNVIIHDTTDGGSEYYYDMTAPPLTANILQFEVTTPDGILFGNTYQTNGTLHRISSFLLYPKTSTDNNHYMKPTTPIDYMTHAANTRINTLQFRLLMANHPIPITIKTITDTETVTETFSELDCAINDENVKKLLKMVYEFKIIEQII